MKGVPPFQRTADVRSIKALIVIAYRLSRVPHRYCTKFPQIPRLQKSPSNTDNLRGQGLDSNGPNSRNSAFNNLNAELQYCQPLLVLHGVSYFSKLG